MLRAILSDFARIPDCHVVTTLDHRRPDLNIDGVRVVRVADAIQEQQQFRDLAVQSNVCLVIAPELGNVLYDRCVLAREAGATCVLNPVSETIRQCSDKLELARFLNANDILTIDTSLIGEKCPLSVEDGPVVVKPRYGAGSQDVRTFPNVAAAMEHHAASPKHEFDEMIVQPLVRGTAVSVGVICQPQAHAYEILPIAKQCLSNDGTFAYEGGRIPFVGDHDAAIRRMVEFVCSRLQGLAGYIGFDLVIPDESPQQPLIVEINPRLTTSYLGYRCLTPDNLASRMLDLSSPATPIRWTSNTVEFTPDGEITRLHNFISKSLTAAEVLQ